MIHFDFIPLLVQYKYPLLIPLGFLEGHLISLVSGFLSHLGYLNIFLAGLCIALGNLLGDVLLYYLGYYKGEKFIKKFGKYIGITDESYQKGYDILHSHKVKILMISKLTNGFGFAMAILFSAGAARIPFRVYMLWNALGEILWTAILLSIGYFFGNLYTTIDSIMVKVSIFIVFAIIIIVSVIIMRKYFKNKMKI